VKLARWQQKYDSIPENTKDPGLMSAKKALLKKKPTRRTNVTYWNPEQFARVQTAPPIKLASKGNLTWRWLAYLLDANPRVEPIRGVIRRRLMEPPAIQGELKRLTRMLVTLHQMGMVVLDPEPPEAWRNAVKPGGAPVPTAPLAPASTDDDSEESGVQPQDLNQLLARLKLGRAGDQWTKAAANKGNDDPAPYEPLIAAPSPRLKELLVFRAVHPLYGVFLMDYLGRAEHHELVQILESLLAMPPSVARLVRVPRPDRLAPGKLALETVDPALLTSGVATQEDLYPPEDQGDLPPELRKYPIPLAQKVRMLFENTIDHAGGLSVMPVWAAGDLLASGGGDFDGFVRSRDLVKQEGILFKHLLRLVLLCQEFAQLTPKDTDPQVWQIALSTLSTTLSTACRIVDPQCTDEMLEEMAEGA
jgi:hypothetical protein